MSESGIPILEYGSIPVKTNALWQWDTTGPYPVATGYGLPGAYTPTKTGLLPNDLQQFVGVPLMYYQPTPTPVPPTQLIEWIRYAEDLIEQNTGLLLCPTWVASPPVQQLQAAAATNIVGEGSQSGIQLLGQDYDLPDAGYDFFFPNAQDSGWSILQTRYRPVRNVTQPSRILSSKDYTGIKNYAYIYPLLSEYFRVPPSWFVEDQDAGLLRLVPAENVQTLPLFAMQLAFMGFAESVPGGIWLQYTAGLMPYDYNTRFRFMKQLVLCQAAIMALSALQGTINMGLVKTSLLIDGVQTTLEYDKAGAFNGLIMQFTKQRDELMEVAYSKVSGPMIITL